jgi:tripartite-type tricarboxylate transporter receptor subunit TctC
MMRRLGILLAAATSLAFLGPAASAETAYPTKAVRIIVPTAPSGGVDLLARLVAQKLSEAMGQRFYVDNRPGAAGEIGTHEAVEAAPDGYTLLMAPSTIAVTAAVKKKLPYDLEHDLTPIMIEAETPYALIVNPSLPVHSVKEFIAYAKAHPGEINLGTTGFGGTSDLAGDLLESMAGIKLTHIPNKGMGPAMADLMAGVTSALIGGLPAALAAEQSGKLRVLAVVGAKRSSLMPQLPTIAEAGVPGYEVYNWIGLLTRKGVSAKRIARLHDAVLSILQNPTVRARLIKGGFEPIGSTSEAFATQLAQDIKKWKAIAARAGAVK